MGFTGNASSPSSASFVMLKTTDGIHMIKRDNIRSIVLAEESPVTSHTETEKVREISFHVNRKGKAFEKETTVGMVYLQKGIRWIPDYRILLLDEGKAVVTLQGTIINELADLEDVNVRLVVGVPNFLMKEQISPIALREAGLKLSSYFSPPSGNRRGDREMYYLSNALMSQVPGSSPSGEAGFGGGPDVPSEGQMEDLFLYSKEGVTLKKGESAIVHLLEVTVPYENLYTWDISPVPPREVWRHFNSNQQRELAKSLIAGKPMHKIRLINTGDAPWTTGPATIFKNGAPLGQQLVTFTSIKNTVDIPVTVATDLNTKKVEHEVSREPNKIRINDNDYSLVKLHGKLTVKNFKDTPVNMQVTRKLLGKAVEATKEGEIALINVLEDASYSLDDYPWYNWNWPWWYFSVNSVSEITWKTTIDAGDSVTFEYDWEYLYR